MIEKLRRANPKMRFNCAGLWVFCPVNKPRDASVNQSAGAHGARFDGRINSRASESIIAELRGGFSQSDDLSVSGRVACGNHGVASSPYHFACKHDDGADGNLSGVTRCFSFGERFVHELFVGIVHDAFRRAKAIANERRTPFLSFSAADERAIVEYARKLFASGVEVLRRGGNGPGYGKHVGPGTTLLQ